MTDPAPQDARLITGSLITGPRDGSLIMAANPLQGQISIGGNGKALVTIHTEDDGRLEYGSDYKPDEAARVFWEALQGQSMHAKFGRGLTQRIDEELAAGQAAQEQVVLLTEGAIQRTALLEECRDILEQAGYNGAHGDDWPRIAPALRELADDRERARQQVEQLTGDVTYLVDAALSLQRALQSEAPVGPVKAPTPPRPPVPEGPPGATRYGCPLPGCPWSHDLPTGALPDADTESTVRTHFSTHDVMDYLAALVEAQQRINRLEAILGPEATR